MIAKTRPVLLAVSILLIAQAGGYITAQPAAPPRFKLFVSLFSFIPDAADDKLLALRLRVKQEFESKNPAVELLVKDLDPSDDPYTVSDKEPNEIGTWLTAKVEGDDPNKSGLHVVEADMVVLGELIRQNLVKPWASDLRTSDWHPAATAAVTIDGTVYGIPHWLCGDFIFSRRRAVTKARNATQLRAALDKGTTPAHLAGRISGSWNFASLYLDAYADTYGANHVRDALKPDLDGSALSGLKEVAHTCWKDGKNPCLGNDYKETFAAPYLFAEGKADAVLGYSERMHYIIRKAGTGEKVHFASAPLGTGNHPLLFVDAFVLRKDCTDECEKAARAFTEYMTSPETMKWILMSEDASTNRVPRYLLPATKSAYGSPAIRNDSNYSKMRRLTQSGRPYPNTLFYDVREVLLEKLKAEVTQ